MTAPLRARVVRPRVARVLVAVVVLTTAACAAPAPVATAPSAPPGAVPTTSAPTSAAPSVTPAPADAQAAVDRLFAAAATGDRTTWDAGVTVRDAAFATRSTVLFDNLRTLRPARLRVHLTGAEQRLPAARQAELGAGARVAQATVAWHLPGERSDATSSVWLTLVTAAGRVRLAGTDDGGGLDTPALPLWWLGPVTAQTRGDVTVLAGPGQDVGRWTGLAADAAHDARSDLPRPLAKGWDGHLVVEVPGTGTDFASVLGASPSAYATTAAVTRPEGSTTRAAVRVVVNPATTGDPDTELATTLTHETVHVATRSAASPAPLWAVEGLAEYVALEAHHDQQADELRALGDDTAPKELPADDRFTAGSKDVTAAYAQAWLACRAVAEHRSRADLGRFYAALGAGRSVDAAARTTLGVDGSTVVGWWHDALRQAAARRG